MAYLHGSSYFSSADEPAKPTRLSVGVGCHTCLAGSGIYEDILYSPSCPAHPVLWGTGAFFARHQGHLMQLAVSSGPKGRLSEKGSKHVSHLDTLGGASTLPYAAVPTHTLNKQRRPFCKKPMPTSISSHIRPAMKLAGIFKKDSWLPQPQSYNVTLSCARITRLQNDFMTSHKQTSVSMSQR